MRTLYSIRLIGGYRTPWETKERMQEIKKHTPQWQILTIESKEFWSKEDKEN